METGEKSTDMPALALRKTARKKIFFGVALVAALLTVAGFWIWKALQPTSLMPKDITAQITTFKPYFYFDEIPADYELSASRVDKEFGVALFSLKKLGRPAITISEQPLSSSLNPDQLLKGGESVRDTAQPAIINTVESRYVGIMIDTDNKTMILLNTTNDAEKQDIRDLLKGLKPVK